MTLDSETIELAPGKTWSQLDQYKWSARGKLPAQPAGLEIGLDHARIAGQAVPINDPEGSAKLEQAFNDWVQTERETARKKTALQPVWAAHVTPPEPDTQALRFQVELDKRGQVHVHCVQANQTLASIGLTLAGFNSLFQQGFMRKPQALHIGALHDWVELDGELCSFEKGKNDAARLEQVLNERYRPAATVGQDNAVVVLLNAASSTGFDIQFPATVGGVKGIHRHHLDEHSLELLQDPEHCGLLHRHIIIKLLPPNLVFKRRTPDGGENYFVRGTESTVIVTDADGKEKSVDLSQPLNFLRLSAPEVSAVLNHPIINRHAQATPSRQAGGSAPAKSREASAASNKAQLQPAQPRASSTNATQAAPAPQQAPVPPPMPGAPDTAPSLDASKKAPGVAAARPTAAMTDSPVVTPASAGAVGTPKSADSPKPLPNLWLNNILSRSMVRHEWLAPLAYRKLAKSLGNSSEGHFGSSACWFISLDQAEDIADPRFKGIFLTEKGGLGFLNEGQTMRFNHGAAFIGPQESLIEGLGVNLIALGLDAQNRIVFITEDKYDIRFGVPGTTLDEMKKRLGDSGAVMMSLIEAIASRDPIEVVWNLPAEQPDPNNPLVIESRRPGA